MSNEHSQTESAGAPEVLAELTSKASIPTEFPPAETIDHEDDGLVDDGFGGDAPSTPVPDTDDISSGVAGWMQNKKITALWSVSQDRNSWIGIGGVGWRKLADKSDSAVVALAMLAAHAREKASPVHCYEGKDKMIYQIYAW
jgi:hypothetical protein